MNEIRDLIHSPAFWFGSVFVGIIVSVISNLITPYAQKLRPTRNWANVIMFAHPVICISISLIAYCYGFSFLKSISPNGKFAEFQEICVVPILCGTPTLLISSFDRSVFPAKVPYSMLIVVTYCISLIAIIDGPYDAKQIMGSMLIGMLAIAYGALIVMIFVTLINYLRSTFQSVGQLISRH